jgi:GNAT superfamily N-acetyltransferase
MSASSDRAEKLEFYPLTPERWSDFEALFGRRGACGGCWCMWWRLKRSEFEKHKGESNRRAIKKIVESGEIPGLLAYVGKNPVAWCAVAPRDSYPVLERSRVLKRVDSMPVWSIVCFYVASQFRRRGIMLKLIKAAVEYAQANGAETVEAYPVVPRKSNIPDMFAFTGLVGAYTKAGFKEVIRRSETRPIMRYYIKGKYSERRT